jgi:hypothetical protein
MCHALRQHPQHCCPLIVSSGTQALRCCWDDDAYGTQQQQAAASLTRHCIEVLGLVPVAGGRASSTKHTKLCTRVTCSHS